MKLCALGVHPDAYPSILLTDGALSDGEIDQALAVGFIGLLKSPFAPAELVGRADQAINRFERRFRAEVGAIDNPLTELEHRIRRLAGLGGGAGEVLPRLLARTAVRPQLSLPDFRSVANALRSCRLTSGLSKSVDEILERLLQKSVAPDAEGVGTRANSLEALETITVPFTPESVCLALGIAPHALDPRCRQLGVPFRQLRRLIAVRRAARALAFSQEHVRQIAFALGYPHASELVRDFQNTFGMSPKAFRALLK
jgi:AraC-like DNA-binding protein